MKKFILPLILLLLLFSKSTYAQINCEVIGVVADSSKKVMSNITVKLFSAKDSLRTVTDAKGRFSFSKINAKQITIHIAALGFNTHMAKYTIKTGMQEIDLGTIIMAGGGIELPDVVIKAKPVAIKYMQDTIEYDARAFNVQDDDRVTDLLRQLPGVEVDENENVTAMGKAMTKLRVNGQDFFTSNVKDFISKLPAGIVAKIQVIDDYGDMANFTGIKIGESNKMLNIVTKPGMDNGQFGGLSITAGTNKQLGANGNGYIWKGTKQISGGAAYNIADNGAGLSQNKNASLNINNRIGKTAAFGVNYNYNGNNSNSKSTQLVETVNTLGKLNSRLENLNSNINQGHNLMLNFNQTTKNIFLSSLASISYNKRESMANSQNYQTGFIRQDFKNNANNSSNTPNLRANLNFSKKLKKNTISGDFSFSNSSNRSNQDILTNTLYYNANGVLEKDSLLNRSIYNVGNNKQFTFSTNYTFFLKKDTNSLKSISARYYASANNTENDLQTFVRNPTTLASSKVDSLSIFTKTAAFNQSLNLAYHQSGKTKRFTAGLNISPNLIRNNYPELNSTYKNAYINISPNLNYSKNINTGKSISISYNGQNNNPGIEQMQPVKNTRNLQNIVIGNPNLKSFFNHSLSASYNYFGKKSNISFQSGFTASTVRNEIVSNNILIPDTLGAYKQETRFENSNGNYNINGNYNFNIPFKSRKYSISVNGNIGNSKKVAIINNYKTFNTGLNFTQGINGTANLKIITASFGMSYNVSTNNNNNFNQFDGLSQPSYNLLLNTGQSFFTTRGFSSNFSATLRLKKFRFNFNGGYSNNNNSNNDVAQKVNNKTQSLNFGTSGGGTVFKSWDFNFSGNKRINKGYNLSNVNPLIINLGISKSFLKSRAISCSLNVNDLLNEGNNISQRVYGNSIIENRSNLVMRVFTLGLNYNMSTFGGKSFRLRTDKITE